MSNGDYANPFGDFLNDPVPVSETAEPVEPAKVAPETVDETEDLAEPDPVAVTAEQAALQARRLQTWVAEYMDLLPKIAMAQPLQPQVADGELRGAERIAASVRQALTPAKPNRHVVTVAVIRDAVVATVVSPPGTDREGLGALLARRLVEWGNIGQFDPAVAADGVTTYLVRRDVTGPGIPWRAAGPRTAKFFADRAGQIAVFDIAKVIQSRKSDGARRYPKVYAWGEDSRGGTCELRLPEGMLLGKVANAEAALRQALNCPDLVVDSLGVHPLIRLNAKPIARDFPKQNPLKASMFVRPRTQAERHVAAKDFVLPLGVRADGSPILINQDRVPHLGIFGGTGAGKTVLLSMIVQAAVEQGGEVILGDAKNGKDLRGLALAGLPGVVSYNAGGDAALHRAVLYAREELARRQALAAALQQKGVESGCRNCRIS